MEECKSCTKQADVLNDDGDQYCACCALNGCFMCFAPAEYEISNGEYVCMNCYTNMIEGAQAYGC